MKTDTKLRLSVLGVSLIVSLNASYPDPKLLDEKQMVRPSSSSKAPKISSSTAVRLNQKATPDCIGKDTRRYTVNLMWINRKLNNKQRYIYAHEEKIQENFLNPIFRWAHATRGGTVQVWYDSVVTPRQAVENTQDLFERYASEYPAIAPIILKDVRTLPLVKAHPPVFSEEIPLSFRVDLLRAIAAINGVSSSKSPYFVYADLDMESLSKTQLFDGETLVNLEKYGIVMSRGGALGFENGFQIVSNHKANLLNAMNYALIELNIVRAYFALKDKFNSEAPNALMEAYLLEIVYQSYPTMFEYFYHLEGLGELKLTSCSSPYTSEPYDREKHGLAHFAYPYFKNKLLVFHITNNQLPTNLITKMQPPSKLDQLRHSWLWVPTKQVPLPPAGLNYDKW